MRPEESVTILAPGGNGGIASTIQAVLPALGPGVRWVRTGRMDGERSAVLALLRSLASRPGSVVHVHTSLRGRALARDAVLHLRARAAGATTVVSFHGWSRAWAERVDRLPLVRTLVRSVLLSADATTALTADQDAALRRWGAREVTRIGNAWDPNAVATRRVPGPPSILFLGRLVPEKRPTLLLDALVHLPPDVQVVLAGAGPLESELRIAAGAFGDRVRLTGWLDAEGRRSALARASALVLPSEDEAMPLAVLEALASGVPVVATPVGAVPELLDGLGFLLDDVAPQSIARTLRRALDAAHDPDRERRSRERASSFAPACIAAAWRATYERARAFR
jgi:glycosyltransferase involved in cell wall biosynthesis